MYKYYLKRVGNNQTIKISKRTWSILNLDQSSDISKFTPVEIKPLFETVNYSQVAEAFSNCRNIKLPCNSEKIAEFSFGVLFALEVPDRITKEEFHSTTLIGKIELLAKSESDYLYNFLTNSELLNILRYFNNEFPVNTQTNELRRALREIISKGGEDSDSDIEYYPGSVNIKVRSPILTRSTTVTDIEEINNLISKVEASQIKSTSSENESLENIETTVVFNNTLNNNNSPNMSKPVFFKPEFYYGEHEVCK